MTTPTFTIRGRDAICNTCHQHIKDGGKDWRKRSGHYCHTSATNTTKETA